MQDLSHLAEWVGNTESVEDTVAPFPPRALAATLGWDDPHPGPGDPLPPGWHWLYTLAAADARALGPDGHAKRGGFLPPVPLPRRMYAGGRMTFEAPLVVGDAIRRESTVLSVTPKAGRSGQLVFVTVRHEIRSGERLLVTEEQDLVYREIVPYAPAAPVPPEHEAAWSRAIEPDPVLLFRFSALTFNPHRIHYDRPYVTGVEGYPALVVHGPLTAILLLDLVRRRAPDRALRSFTFRAQAPLFDDAPFRVEGRPVEGGAELWAVTPVGGVAMAASAEW